MDPYGDASGLEDIAMAEAIKLYEAHGRAAGVNASTVRSCAASPMGYSIIFKWLPGSVVPSDFPREWNGYRVEHRFDAVVLRPAI